MPPRKRRRDYQAEYRARTAARRHLPRTVARGHGALPANFATRLERGEITDEERETYATAIAAYEAKYGPAGRSGHYYKPRILPGRFATREDAETAAEFTDIPEGYYELVRTPAGFAVKRLR